MKKERVGRSGFLFILDYLFKIDLYSFSPEKYFWTSVLKICLENIMVGAKTNVGLGYPNAAILLSSPKE